MELLKLISKLIDGVPEYREFFTVDELNERSFQLSRRHPEAVDLLEIGRASNEEPIYCLRIGEGEMSAVLIGCPHPNEPIGTLTIEHLSHVLAENSRYRDALDCTFYIVKCSDVVGTRLNEGWFKGAFSPRRYALNYYRTPGYKQVEWTFPIEYKTLKWERPSPETEAIMALMEETKPDLLVSLHNASFRAAYFYVTKSYELLNKSLKRLVLENGVPIHLGEPEVPYAERFDDAVFRMITTVDAYEFYAKYGEKDPAEILRHGAGSYEYAKGVNERVFEIVIEVPYIFDERLMNPLPIGIKRRDIILLSLSKNKEVTHWIKGELEELEPYVPEGSLFYEALSEFVRVSLESIPIHENWASTAPELERPSTLAEAVDSIVVKSCFYASLIRLGLLTRLVGEALEHSEKSKVGEIKREVENRFERTYQEFESLSKYEVISIQKLVKIQLGSILYSLLMLKGEI